MSQKYVDPNALNENVIKTKQHVEAVRSALDSAKQNVIQFTTLPVPDATWNDKVVQYTGTTTQNYTKGYFYSCEVVPDTDPTEYRWTRQDVMKPIDADGTTVAYDQVTGVLSAIPATNSTKGIVQHGDGTEIGSDGQVNVVDRLVVTATLPTADDTLVGAVRLYVGASGTYELGGIYQCQETSTDVYEWVLISMADVDLSAYQKTFLGTTAEWNAKTTAQKIEYDEADITDDLGGGMVVTDDIVSGDYNPITSNAVAQIVPSDASVNNKLVTENTITNPNLLDNPWFTVNQRKQSSYIPSSSAIYSVDRWKIRSTTKLDVLSNGIKITSLQSSGSTWFMYVFEDDIIVGETVTVSIKMIDGTIFSDALVVPTSGNTVNSKTFTYNGVSFNFRFDWGTSLQLTIIIQTAGGELSIRAMKLELGSVSTLAMDTAPNYQQELAKCQRYFVNIFLNKANYAGPYFAIGDAGALYMNLPLAVPLRAIPTAMLDSADIHILGEGASATVTTYAVKAIYPNNVVVKIKIGDFVSTEFVPSTNGIYSLNFFDSNTCNFWLSADL